MKVKILIADDHPFTRAGLRTILENETDFCIVGEAVDGEDVIGMAESNGPDVIIMDISMPKVSGIEATKQILKNCPQIKIIALSIHSGHTFVKEMLDAGAEGYLLKDEAPEELIKAIQKVILGDIYLSSGITRTALERRKNSSENNVSNSKLLRPKTFDNYLIRENILEVLDQNIKNPLALISAGAGFGKSVLISQWLKRGQRSYAWVSLDEEQNDFRVFLLYMIKAINMVNTGTMATSETAVLDKPLPPVRSLMPVIMNDLFNLDQGLVLVFDDFHKINNTDILDFFDYWLQYPPPNVHLVIITRWDPPLKLESLKLKGQMTELRMSDLSFTPKDIAAFFRRSNDIELGDSEVQELYEKTEGWILALRLVSVILEKPEDIDEILNKLDYGLKPISDYLISEVLSVQPKNIEKSLVISSILDEFCADIMNEILSEGQDIDGYRFIDWLKESNLFVANKDDDDKWFRYHPLFKSLLKRRLLETYEQEEIERLQLKANQWLKSNPFKNELRDRDSLKIERTLKFSERSDLFTKKELEVLRCIALGMSNKEIADSLFNSEETIKKHINNMFHKTYVKNRMSLVNKAKEIGAI